MNTTSPATPYPLSPAVTLARAERLAGAVRLTEIEPAPIRWLWPGRIPIGYVTLLVSDPGAGKSLVALDVAARVSTGRPWPDEPVKSQESRVESQHSDSGSPLSALDSRLPASVLLLTIEDHFANTVRPRLDALGADCSRILGLSHVPGQGVLTMPRPVAINRDINRSEIGAQAVQRALGHNRRWYWELPAQMSKSDREEIWTSAPSEREFANHLSPLTSDTCHRHLTLPRGV